MIKKYLNIIAIILAVMVFGCEQKPEIPRGDPDNGGLVFPDGFEAVVVADSLGSVRHIAVNSNGDVYVKLRYPYEGGENVALRDTTGDGKADIIQRFGEYGMDGSYGYGTGMEIYNNYLYLSTAGRVIRHKLVEGELVPKDEGEVMLTDDYQSSEHGYSHIAKPITFDKEGHMYIPFGSPSDCCQVDNRKLKSPGQDPCPELEWHAGVWRFDANKPGQVQKDGYKYATGIRSIVGMEWNPVDNNLFAMQHGRDYFVRTWPNLYTTYESALLPSEELLRVTEGTDAGWPYYYYDHIKGKKLLNPEYGGDGEIEADGAKYTQPLIGFPGHWAPNDLHFYSGDLFPERYKNGAFIAFHGSTIRAPYPQSGYFVGFVPFENGMPSGPWEVFADGFPQTDVLINTSDAKYRPMGVTTGPDGSLYITESEIGRVWRVVFHGDKNSFGKEQLAAMEERKNTQAHIKTPDPIKDDLTTMRAEEGGKIYDRVCAACHMSNGKGDGVRWPPLDGSEYVSGDQQDLIEIVIAGLEGPITVMGKSYVGQMPPMGYLEDEEIAKLLTFVKQEFSEEGGVIMARDVEYVRRKIRRREYRKRREQEESN